MSEIRIPVTARWERWWNVVQFGAPVAFAALILAVSVVGFGWLSYLEYVWISIPTSPTTPEGAAKLQSWLGFLAWMYAAISVLTAATQPGSKYLGRAADIALSLVPVAAMVIVMTLFWSDKISLDVYQRKFLWDAFWAAVIIDMVGCTIVAFRISMRSIGFGADH